MNINYNLIIILFIIINIFNKYDTAFDVRWCYAFFTQILSPVFVSFQFEKYMQSRVALSLDGSFRFISGKGLQKMA